MLRCLSVIKFWIDKMSACVCVCVCVCVRERVGRKFEVLLRLEMSDFFIFRSSWMRWGWTRMSIIPLKNNQKLFNRKFGKHIFGSSFKAKSLTCDVVYALHSWMSRIRSRRRTWWWWALKCRAAQSLSVPSLYFFLPLFRPSVFLIGNLNIYSVLFSFPSSPSFSSHNWYSMFVSSSVYLFLLIFRSCVRVKFLGAIFTFSFHTYGAKLDAQNLTVGKYRNGIASRKQTQ